MEGKMKEEVVETVQVALRIRPLVESEAARGCEECIEVVSGEPQVCIKDLSFTFNHVFPPHIGQQEFYDTAVKNLINKLFQGYNVTILAYGQTGSGKTYSMGTNYSGCEGDSVNLGVIPQAVGDIFDYVESHETEYMFKVSVSFMELYQEQCYDLLSSKPRNHSVVEIREDHRGVILPGLTEMEVTCSSETMHCLMRGSGLRAVGATAMNSMSSRSHAVFTIYIYKESRADKNQATTSKFHLVDLAGSERTKKTKATGDRLKEGIKINQGLLSLGNVISALGDGTNRGYICYRDSKLTRLLQDSLGGNSLTLMVACVSPADYNLEETVSTLRYADRARRIRNKPVVNQDAKAAEILRLNNLVNELRLQLIGKAPIKSNSDTDNARYEELLEKERTKYGALLQKHKQVTESLGAMLIENRVLIEKVLLTDAAKERMEQKLTQIMEKCNQTLNMTYDKIPEESEPTAHQSLMECLKSVRFELEDMQSESLKHNEQMMEHDMRGSQNGLDAGDNDSLEDVQEADEAFEAHAMDQVALNKELNELNQAMAIKASVVKRMVANSAGLVTYHESLRENEAKVAALEKEKNELMQQLKNAQTKMKDPLTEERRSKVQALEKEIGALRKQCQKHASVIQALKRDEAKINALNTEIREMKVAKVNLIKRMRTESEKFRRWRAESERDVCRLKAAERKRATAMAKMESMHAKQQSVLKRKMEETVAVNRRLKEALERQKSCQLKRSKSNNKTEALQQFLEQELEIQLSTYDAEKTLEELMEDRCMIVAELERLKTDADEYESNKPKIAELEDDLALRKAQISDLQQKILTADQENKGRTRWDNVQSMMEAKWAMKHLFESLVETKRELQGYGNKYGSHEAKYQHMKEAHDRLMSEYEQTKREFQKKMSMLEMRHEEKVSALMSLGPARAAGGRGDAGGACAQLQAHIDCQQERLEKLLAENERLQTELEELRAMSAAAQTKKQSGNKGQRGGGGKSVEESAKYAEPSDEEVEEDDDEEKDPEWRLTPMYKKLQAQRSRLTMNFTAANATGRPDTTGVSKSAGAGVKRASDGSPHCACRGSCSTKVCGCRKADVGCGAHCKCPHVLCKNRRLSDASDDKENTPVQEDADSPDGAALSFLDSKDPHDGTFIKRKKPYFFYPPAGQNENVYAKD